MRVSNSGEDESSIATSDSEESSSESDTAHNDSSSSPLATDLEQYELMQSAYKAAGWILKTRKSLLGRNTLSS